MVSVCMATFNGGKYIKEQVESILIQLAADDELIISDDSSTDNTLEVISAIKDPRIKVFAGNKFYDPIKNFQNALVHSSGDFIFLSDQDDVWLKGKYTSMLAKLKDYDLVISDSMIVNEQLEVLDKSFFKYFNSGSGLLKNMLKSSYYGSCMAFTRTLLERSLPFPDTKEIGHDLWIGLVAELTGKICFLEEPLILYRRHTNAFTPLVVGKSKRKLYQMLLGRIVMVREVSKYYLKHKLKWKKD